MTRQDIQAVVTRLYTQALTVNAGTSSAAVLEAVLADDFESVNSQETKSKAVLIRQVEGFWKLIPDLRWEPQDFIVEGARAVVRSVASGSPKGPFMGLELDGTRTFRIDTIDIHEVRGGRIVRVFHLEDWATAIRQLSGR
jgi:predicted ester cyclase